MLSQAQAAYVLHSRAYKESSALVDFFTPQGRMRAVLRRARGKGGSLVRPFVPLELELRGRGELKNVGRMDSAGIAAWLHGDALFSGLYLNELLMRLLARDDAHSLLFDHYAAVVRVLATEHGEVLEPLLRSFELLLLREVGLLPALDVQTLTLAPLEPQGRYALVAEAGLRAVPAAERASLSGAQWLQLHAALRDGVPFTTLLRECAAVAGELKPQLRGLLQYHCGHPVLRTRQFMMDLQSL